ncbi:hypothetical protein ACVGVM_05885 [Pseudonocardia bannensis]|uniref:Uncharacterized protein n=1 Tax=Pseudonocardia bannensis TaxID=630973 RepID=A0A848DBP5_9PSEU|nr:hypothetical protein [Pseudonocardia bannensis]NMH90247.1 hypothetical protein [Pseudonocardia bannensis]
MRTTGAGSGRRGSADGTIDGPTAVRAASTGFTILLLGGLLTPIAATYLPVIGRFWLLLTAVVAFAVAGRRIGTARIPALHGACAALGSYLLVLPLVLWMPGQSAGVDVEHLVSAAGTAVAVGAIAGALAGRLRDGSAARD